MGRRREGEDPRCLSPGGPDLSAQSALRDQAGTYVNLIVSSPT